MERQKNAQKMSDKYYAHEIEKCDRDSHVSNKIIFFL